MNRCTIKHQAQLSDLANRKSLILIHNQYE